MTNRDKVLTAVQEYWRENAIQPTIRQVQSVTGINSTSTVRYHYQQLARHGAIKLIGTKPVPLTIYQLLTGESS